MDRTEKLQYEQQIEQYFDKYKVYDLFEKLMKDVIINKPDNVIDYLIERIKRKETKRIFITGYPGTDRKDLSLAVSGAMGYSCLSLDHILEREISKKMENAHQIEKNYNKNMLVDDEIVLELVRNQLIKYEEENVSYIIEGFPRNRVQAIFLQSIGLLPDNIIVLKTSREKAEEKVYQKLKEKNVLNVSDEEYKHIAKQSIDETELNINAVKEVFEGFYCELPVDRFGSSSEVVDEIAKLLKFKNKTNAARRPPRIVLVAPPCSGKESMVSRLAKKLQIIHVSVIDLLKKEIGLKNENSQAILAPINSGTNVPDKFVLKLLEDRLFCSDCMINGWIVTGFPRSVSQINYMDNMNPAIKPSLLVVIDMEEKMIETKSENILSDPLTGMSYRKDSKKYNNVSDEVKVRLITKHEDQGDCLKTRIESWKTVSEVLLQKNCLKLNGEEKKKRLVQLIEDAIGYNS